MGCFNTKGWLSHYQLIGGEKIFGMICFGRAPIADKAEEHDTPVNAPNGRVIPICLPIIGEYDSYGGIHNITRDKNVENIEKFFGTDITTIINTLDDTTTISRCYKDDETHKRYESFRQKLGLDKDYYLSTYEPGLNKSYRMELVLVLDIIEVYDEVIKLVYDQALKGLHYSRMMCATTSEEKEKYTNAFTSLYGDSMNTEPSYSEWWEFPRYLYPAGNDKYGYNQRGGVLISGMSHGGFWDLLLMYKGKVRYNTEGHPISPYDETYGDPDWDNGVKLLYDEDLAEPLAKLIGFTWFLGQAYIDIIPSFPTGQDDINNKVRALHKALSEVKHEWW